MSPSEHPWQIRLLRRCQPVVAGLLRSPLHRLASHELLLLTYRGRTSGRSYTLPLSYVPVGEHLYLCTPNGESRWWRNLRGNVAVDLQLRGRAVRATAGVIDSTCREALDAFRRFLTTYPRTGVMLYGVGRGPDGSPREADVVRQVGHSVVVRITLTSGAPEPAGDADRTHRR